MSAILSEIGQQVMYMGCACLQGYGYMYECNMCKFFKSRFLNGLKN